MEGGGDEEVMYDPHFSSVGSLEETIFDFHSGDPAPLDSNEFPHPPITDSTVLTGELRDKIIKQVEYYLSDEKLKTDKFLLKFLAKDGEGYISIAVIASFKKMKTLTHHKSLVVAALKESSFLTLSSNEKKIKRVRSLPLTEVLDPQLYTVLVENLPEDHSIENMKKIFGIYGIFCVQLRAVVEYETVEAAENAVATLNNEQDWRYGMRVKLLKRTVKNAPRKKVHDPEKKSNVQAYSPGDIKNQQSSEQHDDTPDEEHESHNGEHQSKDIKGNRGQNGRCSRKQNYQGPSGMGNGIEVKKKGKDRQESP